MKKIKRGAPKCECGRVVSKGSVFCSHCVAEVNRRNFKTMKNEDRKYQKSVQGKGSRKKK
ncbi:MAG: hypothetical protein KKB81_01625 [Candidatus Margulisbacteria bacterium]|nr:hypothetical protein [Candidatus Margulisiibacteriota bacterium]MBU1021615.1 hypothetical protein [Candidatus Margulisiibacteriota bacterium]